MDRAIAYTSAGRLIQAVGGVAAIVLISTCLTGVEQGFYYTFVSILSIQVFFELGLSSIITQFVAHEKAHLTDRLEGEERYRSRLAYLLRFCLKWYSILAGGLFGLLLITGFLFFARFGDPDAAVVWRGPWVLLSLGTTANFLIAPISSFLEGLGKVRQIAFVRLIQQLVQLSLLCAGLLAGFKLYASAYTALVGAAIFVLYAHRKFWPLLRPLLHIRITERISYRTEILPFQWRIALSWISGFFILSLFNPVLFATEGAVVAAQMGMTLQALNAVQAFAMAWINTKIPSMSSMIARREWRPLDALFGRTLRQSLWVMAAGTACFFAVLYGLRQEHIVVMGQVISERFLPYLPTFLLAVAALLNTYLFSVAAYLHSHKQEPLIVPSVVIGLLCLLSTLLLSRHFGLMGVVWGYTALCVANCLWSHAIYISKKRQWHL